MKELDLEIPRIRLGKTQRNPELDDFIEEYYEMTNSHPFDSNYRILGDTAVHLSKMGDKVHIHDILSLRPNTGAGTDAIRDLISLSDKYGIPIDAFAKAYHKNSKFITDTDKLLNWYKKLGFRVIKHLEDGYQIQYDPK